MDLLRATSGSEDAAAAHQILIDPLDMGSCHDLRQRQLLLQGRKRHVAVKKTCSMMQKTPKNENKFRDTTLGSREC